MHIKEAMQAKQIGIDAVSSLLGIHRNTAANKMSGDTQFTMQEGFLLKKNLFPEYDMEYLFSPNEATPSSAGHQDVN